VLVVGVLVVLVWGLVSTRSRHPATPSPPNPVDLSTVMGLDRAVLERCSGELVRLGFTPLLDFELPQLQSKVARIYYSSFRSADLQRIATVDLRLQGARCIVHVFFDTWFLDDKRLVTTNGVSPSFNVDPDLIRVPRSNEWDLGKLLAAHDEQLRAEVARGHVPRTVDDVETFGRLLQRSFEREIARLLASGMFRREGDQIVRTVSFELRMLAKLVGPFVSGRSVLWHAGLGLVVALAAVAAAFGTPGLTGIGVGLLVGLAAGLHGLGWIVCAALVMLAAGARGPELSPFVTAAFLAFAFSATVHAAASSSRMARWLSPPPRTALVIAGLIAATCASRTVVVAARSEAHVLPAGYRGAVVVEYGVPGTDLATASKLRAEHAIPSSGLLFVPDSFDVTESASRRFVVYDGRKDARSRLPQESPRFGLPAARLRVCHLKVTSAASGATRVAYFVGDGEACTTADREIARALTRADAARPPSK